MTIMRLMLDYEKSTPTPHSVRGFVAYCLLRDYESGMTFLENLKEWPAGWGR